MMHPDNKVEKVYLYPKPADFRKPIDGFTERAIKPFVIWHKACLLSDTPSGATACAQIYSFVKTAKTNGQEPYTWLRHVSEQLLQAQSVDDYEALLL